MTVLSKGAVRVNIKSTVNNATIRREKRNGRDMIIVPSATLPDDVVMNNIKYPASEIEKSYKTLERTYAPFGHPMIGNNYCAAAEPEAINGFHVGAHNENVRRENGRVFLDKVIDVEVANRTESGRALLEAINKGSPINTSTGIFLELDESSDPGYSHIAKNMYFDHDAILLHEDGAAMPSQGVGMMVNKEGEPVGAYKLHANRETEKPITTINSMVDFYDDNVEWAAKNLFDAIESRDKASRANGFIQKIMSLLGIGEGVLNKASGPNNNGNEENIMPITDEQFKALETKVDALVANAKDIAKDVAAAVAVAVQPLNEMVANMAATERAKIEGERAELVTKLKANGLVTDDDEKEFTINALRSLASKIKPGDAAPMVGGFKPNAGKDDWSSFDPNADIEAAAGKK